MARTKRGKSVDPSRVQVMHVYNRCARQGHLLGRDPETGKDRSHRRGWVRERLQHLAGIFAVEILTYAVLSTHTHQVVRSRPDLAQEWDPETIARRWLSITPKFDRKTGELLEPTAIAIKRIADDAKRVEKLRLRLSDISWWMRYFAQYIAVRANREDGRNGNFWDARFKAELLLDVASVLRCLLYVDLNLVRAGMAESIQESDFTGAKDRLDDLRVALAVQDDGQLRLMLEPGGDAFHWERLDHPCSGWLSPIELDGRPLGMLQAEAARDSLPEMVATEGTKPDAARVILSWETGISDGMAKAKFADSEGGVSTGGTEGASVGVAAETIGGQDIQADDPIPSSAESQMAGGTSENGSGDSATDAGEQAAMETFARRASDKGAVPLSLAKYLMLLDLVGRRRRAGGGGVIDEQVETLIAELGIQVPILIESILVFDKRYDIPAQPARDSRIETTSDAASVAIPTPKEPAVPGTQDGSKSGEGNSAMVRQP